MDKKEYEASCRGVEDDEINKEIREIRNELGKKKKEWTWEQRIENERQVLQRRANRTGMAFTTANKKTYYPENWTDEQKRAYDEEKK